MSKGCSGSSFGLCGRDDVPPSHGLIPFALLWLRVSSEQPWLALCSSSLSSSGLGSEKRNEKNEEDSLRKKSGEPRSAKSACCPAGPSSMQREPPGSGDAHTRRARQRPSADLLATAARTGAKHLRWAPASLVRQNNQHFKFRQLVLGRINNIILELSA